MNSQIGLFGICIPQSFSSTLLNSFSEYLHKCMCENPSHHINYICGSRSAQKISDAMKIHFPSLGELAGTLRSYRENLLFEWDMKEGSTRISDFIFKENHIFSFHSYKRETWKQIGQVCQNWKAGASGFNKCAWREDLGMPISTSACVRSHQAEMSPLAAQPRSLLPSAFPA